LPAMDKAKSTSLRSYFELTSGSTWESWGQLIQILILLNLRFEGRSVKIVGHSVKTLTLTIWFREKSFWHWGPFFMSLRGIITCRDIREVD
jgi:hypothetical protein